MLEKARKKLWILRHVKKSGTKEEDDLLRIFNTIIRPTVEYAVPMYHPLLTNELSDAIEGIQKRASKIVFGWQTDYDSLIASGKIESLYQRREKLTLLRRQQTIYISITGSL